MIAHAEKSNNSIVKGRTMSLSLPALVKSLRMYTCHTCYCMGILTALAEGGLDLHQTGAETTFRAVACISG